LVNALVAANASEILPSVDELEAQRRRWPVRPILGTMTVA
jgi:hypothetical protein